jgi:hypothetical protein
MNRTILGLSICLAAAVAVNAQQAGSQATGQVTSQATASAQHQNKSLALDSGTQLSGQLQSAIDVRRAKAGDPVVLKTTKAIKSGGQVVVAKGSHLVGHVTEVVQRTKDNGASRIGILFDRLEQGSLQTPIAATITSVTTANSSTTASSDDMFANNNAGGSMSSSGSARTSSSGGLLAGAGNVVNSTTSTVGGVVGGTTSAVGSTINSTSNAAGNTTSGLGRSLNGIHISQSSDASVQGSSVLSLSGGNLRLEKGTNFNLVLTESTSATASRNP